jgi:hypothetical protein
MLAKSVACILTTANAITNADHETPRYRPFVRSILSKFYIVEPRVEEFEDRVLRLLRCFALGMPGRNPRDRIYIKSFDEWPAGAELSPDARTLMGGILSSTGYHLMSETVTPDECVTMAHEFLYRFVHELVEHGRVVEIPILVSCPCGQFTASLIPRLMDHFVTTSCTSPLQFPPGIKCSHSVPTIQTHTPHAHIILQPPLTSLESSGWVAPQGGGR